MKLIAYCRVSTEEQERSGLSLLAQEDRVAKFALALGHEVVEVVVEQSSAKIPMGLREGGSRVLAGIRAGRADGLAILRLDRLTRSLKDLLDIVERSRLEGWSVISASETLDTSTPAGRLVVSVLGMVNQFERETTVERTKEALSELRRQGKRYSHRIPYGYAVEGDRLVPEPLEQAVIEAVLAARGRGKSWAAVAAETGARGSRTGRPWEESVLRKVVQRAEKNGVMRAA